MCHGIHYLCFMQRLIGSFSWVIAISLLAVTSCTIETAQPIKSNSLVIASDFLHAEDTVLFKDFIKDNDVRLKIRHLTADQIIRIIKEKRYNSGLDMVLSQNMHTSIKLNRNRVLHDLIDPKNEIKSQNLYISYKHNFIGIGLDPFVFKYTNDTLRGITHYEDLNEHHHYHTLSYFDKLSFLSPIRKKQNRVDTYNWAQKWNNQTMLRPEKGPWRDSAEVVLCRYSQLRSFNDSIWKQYPADFFFPNQDRNGVYFEVMTLSIVQQAEHFADAQKFIKYCQNSGYNAQLNADLNRFPIYKYLNARIEGPTFYTSNLDELLKYHDVLVRIIDKLD